MALTITDQFGKVRGHWVAKTSRGFNKKQRSQINAIRELLKRENGY
jgi:hypothetical protein